MDFIIVVFPVPGPPVMILTLLSFTASIASFCFSESSISSKISILPNSFFIFLIYLVFLALFRSIILFAIDFSVSKKFARYTHISPFSRSSSTISPVIFKLLSEKIYD